MRGSAFAVAAASVLAFAGSARAADEEIQVYMDEMSAPGAVGLDVHTNDVLSGDDTLAYPGEQVSLHRLRVTPEFAYGLTPDLELGAYLPLATLDRDGRVLAGGAKARLKFIAPRPSGQSWFWGANFEIGRVRRALDINPWNAELKGIYGVRSGPWTLAFNLNLDWTVSGPRPEPASLELATKVSYRLAPDTSVGLESYNGLGSFKRFGRLGENDQALYAVIDKGLGKWDLNLGVGRGFAASKDGWVVKAVIGVPIGN